MSKKPNVKLLFRLLNILGLTVRYGDEVSYCKRVITVNHRDVNSVLNGKDVLTDTIHSITHEIGHYIVAPKGRRKLKDYGIPIRRKNADNTKFDNEEHKAVLIGLALQDVIGVKRQKVFGNTRLGKENIKWFNEEGKKQLDFLLSLV